jgi:hypothetical protein
MYQTRLAKLQDRRSFRQGTIVMLITLCLWLFLLLGGLAGLSRLAELLASINYAKQEVAKKDIYPPSPPVLSMYHIYTNKKTIELQGVAESSSNILLYINDEPLLSNTITNDQGQFTISNISITKPEVTIYLTSTDQAGNKSQKSKELKVYFKDKKPNLNITDLLTDKLTVTVKGFSDTNATLLINDTPTVITPNGQFERKLQFDEGSHTIEIKAIDVYGNTTVVNKEVQVKP